MYTYYHINELTVNEIDSFHVCLHNFWNQLMELQFNHLRSREIQAVVILTYDRW